MLANVKGRVNKNLPPIANNIARINKLITKSNLTLFQIFFEEMVVNFYNNK